MTLLLAAAGMAPAFAADDLGKNLAGEACHLSAPATPGEGADILCGTSAVPAGAVHPASAGATLPPAGSARVAAIIAAARSARGSALAMPDAASCDGGKAVDDNTILFFCTLRSTAWPRIVVAAATPRGVLVAEGLPTQAPVLKAALGISSSAATDAVRAKFPARQLEVSAGDYVAFLAFVAQGRQLSGVGNFGGAEAAYRGALDVETRLFGPDSAAVGETLIELALQVSNQSRFDEAAALFRRAVPILEGATSAAGRTRLASYRALDAANQRDYANALKYARDATNARRAEVEAARTVTADGSAGAVPPALEAELVHDLRIQAEMAMRLGNLPGAQASAQEALYIVTQRPSMPLASRSDMVTLMGEINDRAGRVVVAERDFTDAVAMNRKLYGDGGPTVAAQLRLGKFYSDQQLYPAAIASYRAAFAAVARDPVARGQIVADQIIPFLKAAAAAGSSADEAKRLDAEMYAASQLVSTGVADQTIARLAAREAASDPALAAQIRAGDDAARAAASARMDLAVERAKPDSERDPAREKALAARAQAAIAHSDELAARLRTAFPGYVKFSAPAALPLSDLQQRLRPHEAFASYVIGVRASYVLLATRTGLVVRPVAAGESDLATAISDLRSAFTPKLGKMPDFSLKNSYALYRQLLGPVEPELAGIDRLVVAAGGDLASLPFSLLVTGDPQTAQSKAPSKVQSNGDAAWLIRRMAVAQVPSPRAFAALRGAHHAPAPRPFLGVGNPDFSGGEATPGLAMNTLASMCQQGGPADAAMLRALVPLPDTEAEVRSVARDLNASPDDIQLGAGATEPALRARALDQYAVLYFATHGLLPGELHCQAEPGLVLSPPTQTATSAAADGLLTASEIASLKLNADLVVLSACNTAAAGGRKFGGGALDGLADAFFEAGAHGVLASHWEVPSAATTRLMTALFARLSADPARDVADALRQAQLGLIADPHTAHPFNWAAFTLIGDGTTASGGTL
ncbi:MAG TPA: CHAT domain-containing tetratricopeptide repeat protein [Rhizomicrobium sp.]|nr:CHAT domain-containing tetratricopeptide repeat protein [Rhizomicrobium sp.]